MSFEIILLEAKIPFSGKSIGLAAKCMIDRAFSGGIPSYTFTFPL
jgi:hypothetical protein